MDIASLKLFSVVATKLNFVAAANDIGMDPSSVSRKITQLEKALGATLFNRNTRSMALTAFGARFVKHAEFILREYDLALENAQRESKNVKGTLRVTASVAFAERILAPLLPKFLDQYPDIAVHLLPSDVNLDLAKEAIDVAIRLTAQVSGDYIVTRLFKTRYAVYASPEYLSRMDKLKSPEELAEVQALVYDLPGFRSHWKFRSKSALENEFLVEIKGRMAVSSPAIMRKMTLMGQGPALLANWLVKEDVAAGCLQEVFPDYEATPTSFDTGAWILYVNNSHIPKKITAFINFLKSEVR